MDKGTFLQLDGDLNEIIKSFAILTLDLVRLVAKQM
jgi:hypothetical protein